jgi:hypothetical protein
MLPLALGVGEAEVDPLDLAFLDRFQNRARVIRHDQPLCPGSGGGNRRAAQ